MSERAFQKAAVLGGFRMAPGGRPWSITPSTPQASVASSPPLAAAKAPAPQSQSQEGGTSSARSSPTSKLGARSAALSTGPLQSMSPRFPPSKTLGEFSEL
ncbi:unnamed protein product, partial [Polarella glacialis]